MLTLSNSYYLLRIRYVRGFETEVTLSKSKPDVKGEKVCLGLAHVCCEDRHFDRSGSVWWASEGDAPNCTLRRKNDALSFGIPPAFLAEKNVAIVAFYLGVRERKGGIQKKA